MNTPTPAEEERLALLMGECAEVIQACSKILRFGYDSNWNGKLPQTNRLQLEIELGHVINAMVMMDESKDVHGPNLVDSCNLKADTIGEFLFHQ